MSANNAASCCEVAFCASSASSLSSFCCGVSIGAAGDRTICGQQPLRRPEQVEQASRRRKSAAPDFSAATRQGIKTARSPAEKSGEREHDVGGWHSLLLDSRFPVQHTSSSLALPPCAPAPDGAPVASSSPGANDRSQRPGDDQLNDSPGG